MSEMPMTRINNVPGYAWDYDLIVYRIVNGEKWFFGAYNEVAKALSALIECGNGVYNSDECGIANTSEVERSVNNA